MEQADLELQLKVWKELAVSKQMLIQTATKALGLGAECSSKELEDALKANATNIKAVEKKFKYGQDKAIKDIALLEVQLKRSAKENKVLLDEKSKALDAQQAANKKVESGKSANSEELKKIKVQLADKQKEIKQITKVLADTPENVIKKMKMLRKEKMDEGNARKRAEDVSRKLRKDKDRVEKDLKDSKATLEQAGELVSKYRELDKFTNEQYNQLAEKVEDKKLLDSIPMIDEELLESIEAVTNTNEDKKDSK